MCSQPLILLLFLRSLSFNTMFYLFGVESDPYLLFLKVLLPFMPQNSITELCGNDTIRYF